MKPFGWIWVNYQKNIKPHFYETEHEAKNIQANWGGEVFSVYKEGYWAATGDDRFTTDPAKLKEKNT